MILARNLPTSFASAKSTTAMLYYWRVSNTALKLVEPCKSHFKDIVHSTSFNPGGREERKMTSFSYRRIC